MMDFHLLATIMAGLILFLSGVKSDPCPTGTVNVNVSSASDMQNLTDAINCTGQGDFNVMWYSSLTLERSIEVSNMKNLTVTGLGFPTLHGLLDDDINGSAFADVGGRPGIFSVSGGSTLSLKHLVLDGGNAGNGGAVHLVSGSSALVYGCHFTNNNASSGGAIYSANSSVEIDGNTTFMTNSAVLGGAIYAEGSDVHIKGDTVFGHNSVERVALLEGSIASYGGAVCLLSSKVYINGSTAFLLNSAYDHGGAVYAELSEFYMDGSALFDNNIVAEGSGGALYSTSSEVYLDGITCFANNSADEYGGAVYAYSSGVRSDGDTKYIDNYARISGGALNAEASSAIYLRGSTQFTTNFGGYEGGAVAARSASNICMEGNTGFSSNSASSGGAVFSVDSEVYMNGTVDFAYSSASRGGAVHATDSEVYIGGRAEFGENSAEIDGGAVFATSCKVYMEGIIDFSDNIAGSSGGAVYVESSNLSVDGSLNFINNSVGTHGGALYTVEASEVFMGGSIVFDNNSARVQGGAANFMRSKVSIHGSTLFLNSSSGFQGGAIYTFLSEVNIDGSAIFADNWSSEGGALYADRSIIVTNGASRSTGDLAGNEGMVPNIRFIGNTADGLGGAILINDFQELGLRGILFGSNVATLGGAIYIASTEASSTEFSGCIFEDNVASDGGATYLATGSGVDIISSSVFRENSAEFSGGAIFHTGSLDLVNTSFVANKAGVEGPAIVSIGLIKRIYNVSFSENSFYCRTEKYAFVIKNEGRLCSSCFDKVCARCSTGHLGDGEFAEIRTSGIPVCDEPPTGATAKSRGTTVATLSLEEGYYRTSNQSRAIVKCYQSKACVGGNNTAKYCASGYDGPYCAVCVHGYTPGIAYSCHKCSEDMGRSAVGRTTAVALASLIIVVLLFANLGSVVRDLTPESTWEARKSWGQRVWSCQRFFAGMLPLQAIKIVVTVWQIISQFGAIAGDVYPKLYTAFASKLAPINLDLDVLLSYSCIITTDFYDHLLLATIAPALVLVAFVGSYLFASKRNICADSANRAVLHKHQVAALYLAFFVYSPVSYKIFQTFSCDELDDGNSYLRADYRISCLTPRHGWYTTYALVMVGIYPVGIVALFAYLLAHFREELLKPQRESSPRLKAFGGLWAAYKPSRYYFEVIECGRRLSLTAIAAFVPSHSTAQVPMVLLFAVVFVFISEAISPFEKTTDMNLYRWGNAIIVASMYVAFLMKVDVGYDADDALLTFSGVLILANVFMVVTVLVQTAFLVREVHRAREVVRSIDTPVRARVYSGA